jgi:hypothetical protein
MSQQYGFSKENKGKVDSALDFPRLKLEKKGEKARLAIFGIGTADDGKRKLVLPEPEGGYFFDLRIPGVLDGGQDKFIGSFECLAPEAVKQEDGFDADACPHCAAVLRGNVSSEVMRRRSRKMVLPVIRYKTKAGSSELIVPHSVEAVAWRFTDRYFNVLVDEHEKWASSGGLLGHDLTLTCEVVQYQNFTISMEPEAAYANNRELGKLVIETYLSQTGTLADGLSRQLGNKLNSVDLERKIQETLEAAAQYGIGGPPEASEIPQIDAATIENLAADLLGAAPEPTPEKSEVEVVQAEEVEVTAVASASDGEPAVDFDDFFSQG